MWMGSKIFTVLYTRPINHFLHLHNLSINKHLFKWCVSLLMVNPLTSTSSANSVRGFMVLTPWWFCNNGTWQHDRLTTSHPSIGWKTSATCFLSVCPVLNGDFLQTSCQNLCNTHAQRKHYVTLSVTCIDVTNRQKEKDVNCKWQSKGDGFNGFR